MVDGVVDGSDLGSCPEMGLVFNGAELSCSP
jgi:hypothetical protein